MAINPAKFRPLRVQTPWDSPVSRDEELINQRLNDSIRELAEFLGVTGGPFTQTFSTADSTHAARTATGLTDAVSGTTGTTVAAIPDPADSPANADALRDDLVANTLPKIRNAVSTLLDQHNKLRADLADTAQFLNALVDYLQERGDVT